MQNGVAAILMLLGASLTVRAVRADVVTEPIEPIINRLCCNGNHFTAYKFLIKLEKEFKKESTQIRRLRLTVASKLMSVDGAINRPIPMEAADDFVFTALHPVFPNVNQEFPEVKAKLERAERLFREAITKQGEESPSFKHYYSNHMISVTTSLENHLKLIEVARNPDT